MKTKYKSKRKYRVIKADKLCNESILIACEDSVSSPTYINRILNKLKENNKVSPQSCIVPHNGRTNPLGVLNNLLNYRTKCGKTYKDFQSRWIVIDRDKQSHGRGGHSKKDFKMAIKRAKKQGIHVAYANPCFEIWYLLHFVARHEPVDRYEVVELVVDHIKSIDEDRYRHLAVGNIKSEKKTNQIYKDLKSLQKNAIENAKHLKHFHKQSRVRRNPENSNPLTNIDELIVELNSIDRLC